MQQRYLAQSPPRPKPTQRRKRRQKVQVRLAAAARRRQRARRCGDPQAAQAGRELGEAVEAAEARGVREFARRQSADDERLEVGESRQMQQLRVWGGWALVSEGAARAQPMGRKDVLWCRAT